MTTNDLVADFPAQKATWWMTLKWRFQGETPLKVTREPAKYRPGRYVTKHHRVTRITQSPDSAWYTVWGKSKFL